MDGEIDLLSRVAVNHLFLGQLEPFRALLLSLRRRHPALAAAILRRVVLEGGRIDGALVRSPSELAWLATAELLTFDDAWAGLGMDRVDVRLKVEFLVLAEMAWSRASESADPDGRDRLRWILDWGARRLKGGGGGKGLEEAIGGLREAVLRDSDVFDALCWNLHGQHERSKRRGLETAAAGARGEGLEKTEGVEDAAPWIHKHVQTVHLDAMNECIDREDLEGAISHIRYLHLSDDGLEDTEYRSALRALIEKVSSVAGTGFQESRQTARNRMLLAYEKAISSGSTQLVQMIQAVQDESISDDIEQHIISNGPDVPLPLQKYLDALKSGRATNIDAQSLQKRISKYCMIDMYHHARISGTHILESTVESALYFVKREHLQEASDVLYLFPLLRPLVAVMGWDLLAGKTELRRKMMHILWTSKSQALRLEEHSFYRKQEDEMSCIEYLCDILCFHLDLASFVAYVNSGNVWNSKGSMLFSRKEYSANEQISNQSDPFVENFVLERLAVQTPLRVLFDVVPGIKFQDAIELITMQPICSTTMAWERMQDIELLHFRYALESAVISLGTMELCSDGDNSSNHHQKAIWLLKVLRSHVEAIKSIPRKIFLLSILLSLLHMDKLSVDLMQSAPMNYSPSWEQGEVMSSVESPKAEISIIKMLLDILSSSLPDTSSTLDDMLRSGGITASGKQALEWRVSSIKHFVEDWEWRLSILQQLLPLSGQPWGWKEALTILRAAPSSLLNLCLQKAKYDIGEEAVHRFSLPAEDKAALELSEWVTGAFQRVSVEDTVSRAAEGTAGAFQELDFSSLRSQLGSLVAILLCIDVAATSARSPDICMQLLSQARGMLAEIYPGGVPRPGFSYWDQIQEVTLISIVRRILQRMLDLLEQEKALTLQEIFSGENFISLEEPNKHGQRQRALSMLHQMIDDAHQGKRQFLSGKLHNLARALAEDETEVINSKGGRSLSDKRAYGFEKEAVLGLAFRSFKPAQASSVPFESGSSVAYDVKDTGKRLLGPLASKSSTYLSSFILYIAMIGDIVDGVDTTHDFNFFSLVYEWPKDLLTRLVFERESSDAAEKVADIMRADFVHEVITACVPPVFPPRSGQGWACIPLFSSVPRRYLDSSSSQPSKEAKLHLPIPAFIHELPQYPLQLDIVKHLVKLSPVRAILACVFGSSILCSGSGSSISSSVGADLVRAPDTERLFYEFALEQSERFPSLNRWIQMQSNLHKVSESALVDSQYSDIDVTKSETKSFLKRCRDPESDTESDVDEMTGSSLVSVIETSAQDHASSASWNHSPISGRVERDSVGFLSLDWENERPYEKAVGRLIGEGKLLDALALSDRFLRNGASDQLLQLLIEYEEDGPQPSVGVYGFSSSSWQYCLRLKDKQLAARLAIKYLHRWDLDPAMDVLTMCSFHLSPNEPIRLEILLRRSALQKYYHILSVDDSYNNWQEVEADCMRDPEGLALRLAGKGAVSAALEVAESAALSVDLRRELQGRQLVKLLTTDPLSGGGPAEASRFLSSLPDPNDALPVAMGAMQQLHELRSKQLLVNFFLKRRAGTLSDAEFARLSLWALGLRILAMLPAPWQQKCSSLHEHPNLILEELLMTKELQHASMILKEFPSLRDDNLILVYSAKAIAIRAPVLREPRISVYGPRVRQKSRPSITSKSNITNSLSNLQREARRAFSWAPRDAGSKDAPKEPYRKRKSSGMVSMQKGSLELMSGIQEESASSTTSDGPERFPSVSLCEEWLLTGDPIKDNFVRSSHRYETSPDIVLFKGLLSLCSDELVSAKGALDLCVSQMKKVLSSQQLPLEASMEAVSWAYHATEAFVQALFYAKGLLKKIVDCSEFTVNLERSRDADAAASGDTSCSSISSQFPDELSGLQAKADFWLGRAELLQSLLGSGIVASLDDIADEESSARLCDRLTQDERYSMAVYTCKKCKIGAFPVWNAWGHALLRMENYAQARIKFKQALQLYKVDPLPIVLKIVDAIEGEPPVDVSAVRSMFQHLAKNASTIMDDSLSADAYLNVLHMPSTFPRSESSRRSLESVNYSFISDFDDGPHSNLDGVRYVECVYYLKEYARPQMLGFMFRHGHYDDACMLFFPPNGLPSPPQVSAHGAVTTSSSPQRPDSLSTDYGTIEDLCDFCIGYGAVDVLENILLERIDSLPQDSAEAQYNAAALSRICNFCETHRHFNYLYKFQVIKKDHFAAGLTCIQLFTNSSSLEEATKHLENAKVHFNEALSTRKWGGETTRLVSKAVRGKSASEKLNEDGLVKFSARVSLQVDVLRAFNNIDGPPWKHSLFGNPNDSETFRRRCKIAEALAEKNFDLAFQVIYQFSLPAVDIYAGVASSLAEKKKSNLLMELFRNIKGTIAAEDWDEVLSAAINTYADKHKERHDRLIDMLLTSHKKVLACVVCGRLKSAFQIASRSGSVADVQYVAHQALQSNAQPVLEMCRQWLSQYM